MEITQELLTKMKVVLRVSTNYTDEELKMWITGAILDLQSVGVRNDIDISTDELVQTCIAYFCLANFGLGEVKDKEFYTNQYEKLRNKISLCSGYRKEV